MNKFLENTNTVQKVFIFLSLLNIAVYSLYSDNPRVSWRGGSNNDIIFFFGDTWSSDRFILWITVTFVLIISIFLFKDKTKSTKTQKLSNIKDKVNSDFFSNINLKIKEVFLEDKENLAHVFLFLAYVIYMICIVISTLFIVGVLEMGGAIAALAIIGLIKLFASIHQDVKDYIREKLYDK